MLIRCLAGQNVSETDKSLFFSKFSEYKGQFEGGKRHGQGTLYHPDGSVFQGLFVFGQVNGKGILTLPNGDKISGEFRQVSFCFFIF